VREANLGNFQDRVFANEMHGTEPPVVQPLYPNPLDEAKKTALHQWGHGDDDGVRRLRHMRARLQSENNIPSSQGPGAARTRMHWLRIDRYYTLNPRFKKPSDAFQKDDEQQFAE